VKGILIAHPSEVGHIDAHFLFRERKSMLSVFMGKSPVTDFPHILTSRQMRLIDFALSITRASAFLCILSLA
jgi:hypothetical protein